MRPIDVVVTWAGLGSGIRNRYNNELECTLNGIERHMPWVHATYVMVPTGTVRPPFVPSPVIWVERDALVGGPTNNSYAVYASAHLIPGLMERFILLDDDVVPVAPSTPSFFYDRGRPIVRIPHTPMQTYDEPIKGFPTTRWAQHSHEPLPLTKSIIRRYESTYPGHLRFVRSHVERYQYHAEEMGLIYYEFAKNTVVYRPWRTRLDSPYYRVPTGGRVTIGGRALPLELGFSYICRLSRLLPARFVNINDNWSDGDREPGKDFIKRCFC